MSSSLLLIRIIPIYISIIATFYPVVKENICRDWETFSSLVLYLPLCYNKNREKKEDTPKDLVNLFGYKSGRVVNKFDGFDVERDGAGNPYVKDHALARFSCKVVEKLDLGTYMLYIAETMEAEVLGEGPALTVDDFKNDGGSTPPTATVVRTLEGNEGWRCTICGYVAEKETLPDGYQCPICRANKDKFVKL